MKVFYMIAALVGLADAQGCSFTEQRWADDETCTGTPMYDKSWPDEPLNECGEDDASPGEYGMIS